MSQIRRKLIHVTVELDIDIHVTERALREFVAAAINEKRAALLQDNLLASTPRVILLSYKEVGQRQ